MAGTRAAMAAPRRFTGALRPGRSLHRFLDRRRNEADDALSGGPQFPPHFPGKTVDPPVAPAGSCFECYLSFVPRSARRMRSRFFAGLLVGAAAGTVAAGAVVAPV